MIYNHIAPSYEDIADVTVTVYMADVVAIVTDVIATVLNICGRCNNHLLADDIAKDIMADVIAKYVMADVLIFVADGIATKCDGLMLLPCGRWNNHMVGM